MRYRLDATQWRRLSEGGNEGVTASLAGKQSCLTVEVMEVRVIPNRSCLRVPWLDVQTGTARLRKWTVSPATLIFRQQGPVSRR
jgi:hypothetical protein